jgi:hypothetical protein
MDGNLISSIAIKDMGEQFLANDIHSLRSEKAIVNFDHLQILVNETVMSNDQREIACLHPLRIDRVYLQQLFVSSLAITLSVIGPTLCQSSHGISL